MSSSSLPLGGQAAIVTGSSRNIGRAIALALASDGAAAVRDLCGPEAGYVTGQALHVNGGRYLP